MNGRKADATALAAAIAALPAAERAEILVCPPFVHLVSVAEALAGSFVQLGAQDCHAAAAGAHTPAVGAKETARRRLGMKGEPAVASYENPPQ